MMTFRHSAGVASGVFLAVLVWLAAWLPVTAMAQEPHLARFLGKLEPASLVDGADGFGQIVPDLPVAPILRQGETVGWVYINTDFVRSTGYSGRPIHVMVAVDPEARIIATRILEMSEPILVTGIAPQRIADMLEAFAGTDLIKEIARGGTSRVLPRVSGATVTIRVIDDAIIRSGIRVAYMLGLGGLAIPGQEGAAGPTINADARAPGNWAELVSSGVFVRLSRSHADINAAFEELGDPSISNRRLQGPPDDEYLGIYATLASVPGIAAAALRDADREDLEAWLEDGEHALLLLRSGIYSFLGDTYTYSGVFERLELVQGETSIRFTTRDHRRVGRIDAEGAPTSTDVVLFRIPAFSGFDPAQPWRIDVLVQRNIGAIRRAYVTQSLHFELGDAFLIHPQPVVLPEEDEDAARAALWQGVWEENSVEIGGLLAMLGVLTGVFFFQGYATRPGRVFYWFRTGFLVLTLVFLGWHANAQLSIVNLVALVGSFQTGFTWDAFLLDPLVFILWFSVAAALLFWGRGAYCGWLCPFGAMQELSNRLARALGVPQWRLPWGLHERLWAVKYMMFLGLFGATLVSLELAMQLAEAEPFKTAVVMRFDRAWPYVLFAGMLLFFGLFVERFYCRYLCMLGAALAIPARLRMFDWLKRYRDCGNPCQTCGNECMVQAIHPQGEINPNECLSCQHCQVLYQCSTKCPTVIRQLKRRAAVAIPTPPADAGQPAARQRERTST